MTVVEVVIAAFMLIIASLAALQIVDSGRRNTARAEGSQVAVNAAQRELEAIRNLDYGQVALTSTPANDSDPNDPRYRVSDTTFAINREGTDYATMVVDAGNGAVDPGPVPFTNGDVSGDLYRFVTWRDDPNVAGTQNFKRIIVAASVNATAVGPERGYFEVQSDVSDPNEGVTGTSAPAGPGDESDQVNYWLSDTQTTAAAGCDPAHVAPSSHAAHNTSGNCGGASGPDYAYRTPPSSGSGALPDYSTDVSGTSGLQLERNPRTVPIIGTELSGCDMGTGNSRRIHRWITPSLNLSLDQAVSLVIFTRQPTASPELGRICVGIAQTLGLGLSADVYVPGTDDEIAGWSCSNTLIGSQAVCETSAYPTGWTAIEVRTTGLGLSLLNRVPVGLAVRNQSAAPNGIQFMYDHPSYPSRLALTPVV